VKISTLFVTAAIALTLAGGAAANSAPAPVAPAAQLAPETIAAEAEHCEPTATTDCDGADQATAGHSAAAAAQVAEAPLPVPELETSLMLMLGLVVLGMASRRRVSDRFDS
jgi:hypothetical protein